MCFRRDRSKEFKVSATEPRLVVFMTLERRLPAKSSRKAASVLNLCLRL